MELNKMSFSDFLKSENQKQHLNLSFSAWAIIENDIQCFYEDSTEANRSNFLNRIFEYYRERSPAAITNQLNEKRSFYSLSLKPKLISTTDLLKGDNIIDVLLENTESELKTKLLNYPKGEGRKFRLTNANYSYLIDLPENSKECLVFQRPGKYLKAIFETYAELPYVEREEIFFTDIIDSINDALEMRKLIKVIHNNNKCILIKPYKLMIDRLSNFNYLVGLAILTDTHNRTIEKCCSLRVSRIKNITKTRENFVFIKHQKEEIEEQLFTKGVQFLVDGLTEIYVRLSNTGVWKYNNQLNLRPQHIRIEADNTYVFNCTERQIEYYFFKFGKDATILSPRALRDKFHIMYSEAANNYSVDGKV